MQRGKRAAARAPAVDESRFVRPLAARGEFEHLRSNSTEEGGLEHRVSFDAARGIAYECRVSERSRHQREPRNRVARAIRIFTVQYGIGTLGKMIADLAVEPMRCPNGE